MGHRLALLLLVACSGPRYFIYDDDLAKPDGPLALIYLLRDPTVRVVGVSCSYGRGSLEDCMKTAARTLTEAGYPEVPVVRGAESEDDLGKTTQAVQFIINETSKGDVTVITAGPPTNLNTVLQKGTTPHIAALGVAIQGATIFTTPALDAVTFDEEDYEALERAGSSLSRYVLDLIDEPGFKPRAMTGVAMATDEHFRGETSGDEVRAFNDVEHFKRRFRERLVR